MLSKVFFYIVVLPSGVLALGGIVGMVVRSWVMGLVEQAVRVNVWQLPQVRDDMERLRINCQRDSVWAAKRLRELHEEILKMQQGQALQSRDLSEFFYTLIKDNACKHKKASKKSMSPDAPKQPRKV